jgi:hypothetical protein
MRRRHHDESQRGMTATKFANIPRQRARTAHTSPINNRARIIIFCNRAPIIHMPAKRHMQGLSPCHAAELPGSAHGLRNAGAAVAQLEAIFGWCRGTMASLYTKCADRIRLSKGSIGKLSKSIPGSPIPNSSNGLGSS